MYAINPNTKKPIRIITTETVVTRTNRTLLWHSPSFQGDHEIWHRVAIIVTEASSLKYIPNPDIVYIGQVLTDNDLSVWKDWISQPVDTLIIADEGTLNKIGATPTMNKSILTLDQINTHYCHLEPLSTSASTEQWVLKIAQLLLFHTFITHTQIDNTIANSFKGTIKLIEKTARAETTLPQIYLIQQYFIHKNPKRASEIRNTLEQNIACKFIDKIILLNEKLYDLPKCAKLEQVNIGKRLFYQDVIKYAKDNLPPNSFLVFSNSDIYFDETLKNLYNIDMDKKFLSLLRYNTSSNAPPKLFGPRPDSQDTWILKTGSIDFEPTAEDFGFGFGVPGCDNAINVAMFKKKFLVANPSLTIKTYHNQESEIRNYSYIDILDKPVYMYLTPTAIQEYNPLKDFEHMADKTWKQCPCGPFNRKINYLNKDKLHQVLDKINKSQEARITFDSNNTYNCGLKPTENCLYIFDEPKSIMSSGAICDSNNLYIGKDGIWSEMWENVRISILTPTKVVPEMCAVYFPESLKPASWFTEYFSEVLRIHAHTNSKPAFLMHPDNEVQALYNILQIPEKHQHNYFKRDTDIKYYSKKTFLLSPTKSKLPSMENIQQLRKFVPIFQQKNKSHVVIMTNANNEQIASLFAISEKQWDITILTNDCHYDKKFLSLIKADMLIASSETDCDILSYVWLMNRGSSVVEIMDVENPRADHIHIAGASGINYTLLADSEKTINELDELLKNNTDKTDNTLSDVMDSSKTITLPWGSALKGFHDHVGDTFREMVEIWEERKYCTVVRSEDTPYVWWGNIGDTLLYDRDTLRWLQTQRPSYKKILYGNTVPETLKTNELPWSYWTRSPRNVEVKASNTLLSWNQRKCKSIFIGRIENGVQLQNRTKEDWSKVIEHFHMPIDSTGGPYKYSQSEYLDLISKSRYGLCLPGYGPKCNREIEYLAMGTVPIIVPGVDMKNYASPPIENVHYFSVKTPEEIPEIIKNTTPEKWSAMSLQCNLWWRKYASAKGLFMLTKILAED